jgi:hypothetical protein
MNRRKVLNYAAELIPDEALVFYIGPYLCRELSVIKDGYFLATEDIDYFSISTGMAMTNSKKIYIIVEDVYLLKYFSSFIQSVASNCSNLFFLLINSGVYDVDINQPTIYNHIRSMKGVMLNLGALIHDYTKHFKTKTTLRQFKKNYGKILGPAVGIIEVEDNKLFNKPKKISPDIEKFVQQAFNGLVEKKLPKVNESLDLNTVTKE